MLVKTNSGEFKIYFQYQKEEVVTNYEDGTFDTEEVYSGDTDCKVYDLENHLLAYGEAHCRNTPNTKIDNIFVETWNSLVEKLPDGVTFSLKINYYDQFIKREGRKIALEMALKQLKLNREDRIIFWKTLFPQYFRSK